jgi:hypothetical protein
MNRHRWAFGAVVIAVALSAPLLGHERKTVGAFRVTVGWGDEPAYTGFKNAVEVDIADAKGAPVSDLREASLSVEISFGDQRLTLPLRPAAGAPGRFVAWLVPTRAGTYTLHVSGKVSGQAIDLRSTCSDTTFECVVDAAEVQFPAKDPSPGQIAERVNRGLPRAEQAMDVAGNARTLALAATALAVLAVAAAVGLGMRKGR